MIIGLAILVFFGAMSPGFAQGTTQDDFGLNDASDPNAYKAVIARLNDVAEANSEEAVAKIGDVKDLIARLQKVQLARQVGANAAKEIQDNIPEERRGGVDEMIEQRRAAALGIDCSSGVSSLAQMRLRAIIPSELSGRLTGGQESCNAAKRDVAAMRSGTSTYEALKRQVEDSIAQEAAKADAYKAAAQDLAKVLSALKEASIRLETRTDAKLRNINSVSTLPWIVGAICVFCIGVMFTVKQFTEPVQVEWVSTGQATQFVTIILLLSVITMLGINERIGENTLGTLLGGVAGYVLAQGVGRSSARDAERKVRAEAPVR